MTRVTGSTHPLSSIIFSLLIPRQVASCGHSWIWNATQGLTLTGKPSPSLEHSAIGMPFLETMRLTTLEEQQPIRWIIHSSYWRLSAYHLFLGIGPTYIRFYTYVPRIVLSTLTTD